MVDTGIVWLRRDLRLTDHAPLARALAECRRVHVVFVFDREILDALPDPADRRVEFIHASLQEIDARLRSAGSALVAVHDHARDALPRLAAALGAQAVYAGRDYEPAACARDAAVARALEADGRRLVLTRDQVVFERDEVLTAAGTPFSVFTPYRNAWLRRLVPADVAACDATPGAPRGVFAPAPPSAALPSLESMGFRATRLRELGVVPGEAGGAALLTAFGERIDRYQAARDFPAVRGPSYLSVHLRFGTVSIRAAARAAIAHGALRGDDDAAGARTWLSELIWRDFYHQVLHHHPRVVEQAFRPEYDRIAWERGPAAEALFAAFTEGRTGYPLVDAAIAQILHSGYMHNRLRMVVASFLTKDLGLDWRLGERWFARHLIDFDLAANNGGWQWAASSGCDAQPYFRIFNPVSQSRKFDPDGAFIRRYLPQLADLPDGAIHAPWEAAPMVLQAAGVRLGETYPRPVVDHDVARKRTLERYAVVKASAP